MTSKTSNDLVKYAGYDIGCAFHLTPEYVYRKLPLCIVKRIYDAGGRSILQINIPLLLPAVLNLQPQASRHFLCGF